MPWHSQNDSFTHGLTKPARRLFDRVDQGKLRSAPKRRHALTRLGAQDCTAQLAVSSLQDETRATRLVFERFGTSGVMSASELRPALSLVGLPTTGEAVERVLSRFDANPDRRVQFAEFRLLYSKLRSLRRSLAPPASSAPPPSAPQGRPQSAGTTSANGSGGAVAITSADDQPPRSRPMSGDDGGRRPDTSTAYLTPSALDLELQHVRRCLLGRAMRLSTEPRRVVHEHQVYCEGVERALQAGRAEWELQLLHNRDVVRARSVQYSIFGPGRGTPQHAPALPSDPFESARGGAGGSRRKRMTPEQRELWASKLADKVTHLQRAKAAPSKKGSS